ncbi:MAG: beta strand repeat-containing protein, partial [Gaiellaceae bacterium]
PDTSGSQIVNIAIAGANAGRFAGGAAISLNWIYNDVQAGARDGASIQGPAGVTIGATDSPQIDTGTLGFAGSDSTAVGAAIAYNYIGGDPGNPSRSVPDDPSSATIGSVHAFVDGAMVNAASGDVAVEAISTPEIIAATVGAVSSTSGIGVAGSISINFIRSVVDAAILDTTGTGMGVTAQGTVTVSSVATPLMLVIAGAGAKGGTAAVGIASATNDMRSDVNARIEGSTVKAQTGNVVVEAQVARPSTLPNYDIPDETWDAQIWSFAISGAVGGSAFGAAASLSLNWVRNTVDAHVSDGSSVTASDGTVTIEAHDHAGINSLAGGVRAGGTSGFGGSVAYNYLGGDPNNPSDGTQNEDLATVDDSTVTAGSLDLEATSDGAINNLSVGGVGAGNIAIAGALSLNFIRKRLEAQISGGSHVTTTGDVTLNAADSSTIRSLAGQLTGAGSVAAGVAVAYNSIANELTADVSGSTVTVTAGNNGNVTITAASTATIGSIAAGISGSKTLGIAGSGVSNHVDNTIDAFVDGSTVETDGSIAIVALSHDSVSGYAGTIAGSTVGGGGTVVVDYLANTTTADATSSTLGAAGNGSGVTVEQWATDDSGTESS